MDIKGIDISKDRLRVLIIEENEEDVNHLISLLTSLQHPSYDVQWIKNHSDVFPWLQNNHADIALMDLGTLHDSKLSPFAALNSQFPHLPIIVLNEAGDEETALAALKMGAQDCLQKNKIDEAQLGAIMQNAFYRKKAELRLREMLKRYELAVHGSTHGLWDWNLNPNHWDDPESMIWYSTQLLSSTGERSLGDVLPERYLRFEDWKAQLHPLDRDRVIQNLQDHLNKKGHYDVQCRIRMKEGGYRWFHIRGEAVWNDQGQPVRMAGSSVDITGHKQEEHELLIAEEKYRKVFENSAVAITVSDENERIISWNKFTENMLGMTHEDLHLKPIESCYPPDEWKKIRSYKIREKGMQHHLETKMLTKNGDLIDIDVSISVLKDPDGQITGSIGIIRDITERKKSEVVLKKLSSVVEQIGDSVIITDRNGIIEYVNPSFEQNSGYSREEVIGKTPRILKSGRHDEEFYKTLWSTILSGQVFRNTFINKKKNGELTYEEQVITPLKDNSGNITHFVSTARDITFRKMAEEALKNAKDAAETANRAKSDFLANMSHEIRTPMNGVIGMAGLLLDTDLTMEQKEYAEGVRASAETLLTLINDILDFSKIEAGKLTIEPIPFDLQVSLEEVADMVAVKASEKNIELIIRYDPEAPRRIIGDAGRIRQILANLVSNAVKFTERGHVLINIECTEKNEHEAKFSFSVEDSGIGISEDNLKYIFDKFTQADASTTRKYGGTGLGLAISKQLVEMMGGQIGARSQPGKGSTFWFTVTLPVDKNPSPEDLPHADLSGLKVLIVDDHEVNRQVLMEQVTSWGMKGHAVATAAEALGAMLNAHVQEDPYQIALLDFQLPGMDGEMLARVIKVDPNLKDTLLVLLTSMGMRGDAQRLMEAGFAAYLVKPVHQNHVHEVLSVIWGAKTSGVSLKLITRHTLKESKEARLKAAKDKDTSGTFAARVLLAEDNAVNQQVARRMLEKIGCRVDVVANGKEAIKMSESFPYDIVFMDCQMPEMDGYEATRQIRRRDGNSRHQVIVALTAHALEGEKEKCIAVGMDDYLSKPVKKEHLLTILKKWVKTESLAHSHQGSSGDQASIPVQEITTPSGQLAAISQDRIDSLSEFAGDDDPNFIINLFETFFESAAQRIASLKEALNRNDADLLRRDAHSLKGSSINLGAQYVADISKQLEMLGKSGSIDGALSLVTRLEDEMIRVKQEFEEKFKGKKE